MSKTIEFVEEKIKMLNVVIESTVKIIKEFDGIASADSYKKLVEDHLKEIGTFQQIKVELEAWEIVKEKQVDIFYINVCKNAESYNKYKTSIKKLTNDEFDKLKKALEVEE